MGAMRWITIVCCAGAALPTPAQTPEQNRPQAQLIFEGGSATMTSQRPDSAAGVAAHFEDVLPTLGRLTINSESLGNHGTYQSGEDYIRLQGPVFDGLHFGFVGGDFRISSNLMDPLFGNFFFPEIAARGFSVEATKGDRTYAIYAGSETLPLVPVNFFRARAPQSLFGISARRGFGKRLRLGARLLRLSGTEHQIEASPFLFMLPAERRFRSVTSVISQSTYKVSSHLRFYGEGDASAAERTEASQVYKQSPLSGAAGAIWESPLLTLKADYVYQTISYLPLTGYFLGDRRGPYGEVRYKPIKRLELNASVGHFVNNLERDPLRPEIQTDSSSVVATLSLPAKVIASAQATYTGMLIGFAGSPPSYMGNRLLTASLTRPLKNHNLRFSLRQMRLTSAIQGVTEVWPELEDTFTSKRFTATAALRMQRQALWMPVGPAFRGAAEARLARITAGLNLDSANLQGSTVLTNNSVRTLSFRATANVGRGWNFEIQSSQLRITSLSNVLAPGLTAPVPQLLFEQGTFLFRFTKQIKRG
jgi:hypothetical protein